MRLTDRVARRARVFGTCALSGVFLAALPAQAEGWAVTHVPGTLGAGEKVCILYSGTVAPVVSISVYESSSALSLQDDVLTRIASGTQATLTFPAGARAPIRLVKASPDSDIAVVPLASAPGEGAVMLDDLLGQFSVAGRFSAAGADWDVELPSLPDASASIRALRSCKAGLENAVSFDQGMAAFNAEDFASAGRLWRPIADEGYAMAQLLLGLMYDEGAGVEQDRGEADRLICQAAASGLEQATAVADDFEINC